MYPAGRLRCSIVRFGDVTIPKPFTLNPPRRSTPSQPRSLPSSRGISSHRRCNECLSNQSLTAMHTKVTQGPVTTPKGRTLPRWFLVNWPYICVYNPYSLVTWTDFDERGGSKHGDDITSWRPYYPLGLCFFVLPVVGGIRRLDYALSREW